MHQIQTFRPQNKIIQNYFSDRITSLLAKIQSTFGENYMESIWIFLN